MKRKLCSCVAAWCVSINPSHFESVCDNTRKETQLSLRQELCGIALHLNFGCHLFAWCLGSQAHVQVPGGKKEVLLMGKKEWEKGTVGGFV